MWAGVSSSIGGEHLGCASSSGIILVVLYRESHGTDSLALLEELAASHLIWRACKKILGKIQGTGTQDIHSRLTTANDG